MKIFSKLKNLEELGIIDDNENYKLDFLNSKSKSTKVYLNFLEILKLKKLKKLYIYTPYVSTKDLMKIFNKKAGVQEKFIFNYNFAKFDNLFINFLFLNIGAIDNID